MDRSEQPVNPPVYRIALAQLSVTLVFAAFGFGFAGVSLALSISLGGLVSAISNALFIWLFFYRQPVQRTAHIILRTAYGAELSKVIATVTLMIMVLVVFNELDFLIFFAAFMISQLFYWTAPFWYRR